MSNQARREYLISIFERYKFSNRHKKSQILDEFCLVCKYSRKYAIRILQRGLVPKSSRPGPKRKYDIGLLLPHLERLWLASGQINSKKLKQAMPEWILYYLHADYNENVKAKLLQMSASTLERLLRVIRQKRNRGLSTTKPAKRFIAQIPIQPKDWNVTKPGTVQCDTVAHCGTSLLGAFANSLTLTDIHSTWTENRALWTKGTTHVINAMTDIENTIPFAIESFKSDSGSEFMNHRVIIYFQERKRPVKVVRSRPYKKDDNCYVEQKNFTHVRELFGYDRIEQKHLVDLMNEIYKDYWNPLQNFFIPSTKILRKTRIGGRIKKEYELPKTPYNRIMESPDVPETYKEKLRAQKERLNPFILSEKLDQKLKEFFRYLNQRGNNDPS